MSMQEQLNRIAKLLDQLRATDPKAAEARVAVIQRCSRYARNHYHRGRLFRASSCPQIQPLDISGYRDGAVRGLLEEVVETLWGSGDFPTVLGREVRRTAWSVPTLGLFRWLGNAATLASALIEALEERVNANERA